MKVLVFDIAGAYSHYKKAYATTSMVTYIIPPKTSLYGYVGAILGLEKLDNEYLVAFSGKQCLMGLRIMRPIELRRMGINLRMELGRRKSGAPPKPTLVELVEKPKYRIYFHHKNESFYNSFKNALENQHAIYTPSMGLANLISTFEYIGEFETEKTVSDAPIWVDSVIPKKQFIGFDNSKLSDIQLFITEQSLFPLEIDGQRNIIERDDILLERKGKSMPVQVKYYYPIDQQNVILF
jgi:CRISPR-associated protein Cas5h